MPDIKIRYESSATRCEMCHQPARLFFEGKCARCRDINSEEVVLRNTIKNVEDEYECKKDQIQLVKDCEKQKQAVIEIVATQSKTKKEVIELLVTKQPDKLKEISKYCLLEIQKRIDELQPTVDENNRRLAYYARYNLFVSFVFLALLASAPLWRIIASGIAMLIWWISCITFGLVQYIVGAWWWDSWVYEFALQVSEYNLLVTRRDSLRLFLE